MSKWSKSPQSVEASFTDFKWESAMNWPSNKKVDEYRTNVKNLLQ